MAAYPNTNFDADATHVTPRQSIEPDIASDGTVRGRVVSTKEVYDLTLVHKYVSESDAAAIETFYGSNRVAQVEVTWRSVTYNVYFKSKPRVEPFTGVLWTVTSELFGSRADGA